MSVKKCLSYRGKTCSGLLWVPKLGCTTIGRRHLGAARSSPSFRRSDSSVQVISLPVIWLPVIWLPDIWVPDISVPVSSVPHNLVRAEIVNRQKSH